METGSSEEAVDLLQPVVQEQILLQELDSRQDDILLQIDQLNSRIEGLLRDVESWRQSAATIT